jgi:PHP family Zn ribbon phosphoesterase
LTLGVAHRVEELADREEEYKPKDKPEFKEILPLTEIIAAFLGIKQLGSKKVWEVYNQLIKRFSNEYNILLNVSLDELKEIIPERLASLIIRNRNNKLTVKPGFDGQYGELQLQKQTTLD